MSLLSKVINYMKSDTFGRLTKDFGLTHLIASEVQGIKGKLEKQTCIVTGR